MENNTPNWQEYSAFDRYTKISDKLKKVGDFITVVFEDEGRLVSEDILKEAMKAKGIKQKTSDSYVFTVSADPTGEKYEFWVKKQNYTIMRQLATIAKTTLKGKRAVIKRMSSGDPNTSAFSIMPA